jgi:predicted nucleic acid-binding protein
VILVDTSVWIDHLRAGDTTLVALLDKGQVLAHPFVTGEIALGQLRRRQLLLESLSALPQIGVAGDGDVLRFIEEGSLAGLGIGYVDAHLLAAVQGTVEARLWTRDRRLAAVASTLGLAADI